MSGDRLAQALHQERSKLILAVSGNPVNSAMAWQIIHRWDALVEIAEAALEVSRIEATGLLPDFMPLAKALARLEDRDSEATE